MQSIGWTVNTLVGTDNKKYIVIKDYVIQSGSLADKKCDIAFELTAAVPYVFPAAIHTKPHLVPMDTGKYGTQNSGISSEWQYWSRSFNKQPNPKNIVTHIATIFRSV